jgi:muconolactone delta-isomerase
LASRRAAGKLTGMEYLVTMTTHVPDGTPAEAVEDVRTREAARSRELAGQGNLVRLWRPPLQPGEWRSIGLFAASGDAEVRKVLASMPLHVWRQDEITPLQPHPNDPGVAGSHPAAGGEQATEFLTVFNISIPSGTPAAAVDETEAREAESARELAGQGHLLRLWVLPAQDGGSRALGLWQARDASSMQSILKSLPLDAWMTVQTTPLSQHPSDPPLVRS